MKPWKVLLVTMVPAVVLLSVGLASAQEVGPQISFVDVSSSPAETVGTHTVSLVLDTGGEALVAPASVTVGVDITSTAIGNGTDYTFDATIVTFPAGSLNLAQQDVSIPIVDDLLDEFDETIDLFVTGDIGAQADHTVMILDDDPEPTISIADAGDFEADDSPEMQLPVTLSAPSGKTITVRYTTEEDTGGAHPATEGVDYEHISNPLTFEPGRTLRRPSILILDDSVDEFDETFIVRLTDAVNVTIEDGLGIGTILDDDLPPSCNGIPATILGTSRADILLGTPGPDVIVGLGGNDEIDGRGGDDVICGNSGSDVINGSSGNDVIFGGAGRDVISGGSGNDEVRGGENADEIRGNTGDDTLFGGKHIDKVWGGKGVDAVNGGKASDELLGGAEDDTVWGKGGDDQLNGGSGFDVLKGGFGTDTCIRGEQVSACE